MNSGTAQAPVYDWSQTGNWQVNGAAPTTVNFQSTDKLVFPTLTTTGASYTATDDLPATTSLGTISFTGDSYTILGNNTLLSLASITTRSSVGTTVFPAPTGAKKDVAVATYTFQNLPLTFSTAGTITVGFSADTVAFNSSATSQPANLDIGGAGNTLTVSGPGAVQCGYAITDAGGLIMNGTGQLTLNVTDTYTGGTTVKQGALVLTAATGNAVPGDLVIGTGSGAGAVVQFGQDNQVPSTVVVNPTTGATRSANLTVYSDGTLNLNSHSDIIGVLTMDGGVVETAGPVGTTIVTGTLTLGGDVTTLPSSHDAVISGHIDLGNGNQGVRTFNVGLGTAPDADLWITATIGSAVNPNVTLFKQGAGWMWLQPLKANGAIANNTYSGPTVVNSGTLDIESAHALGNSPSTTVNSAPSNGTTDSGTLYVYAPTTSLTITQVNEQLRSR